MEEKEVDPVKLEIFRLAHVITQNEYSDQRAQDHNRWVAESERMWAQRRMKIPYPDFPPYPNEEVIVARAQILLNFLYMEEAISAEEREKQMPLPIIYTQAEPLEPPSVTKPSMRERIRSWLFEPLTKGNNHANDSKTI